MARSITHDRDAAGARIVPGAIERFEGARIQVVPVPPESVVSEHDPMGQWFAHYSVGRTNLEPPAVLQLLWSDRHGVLPGVLACHPAVDQRQPRLNEHPQWVPGRRLRPVRPIHRAPAGGDEMRAPSPIARARGRQSDADVIGFEAPTS